MTSSNIIRLLAVTLYITLSTLSFGALNARDQYLCHYQWKNICDTRMVNKNTARAIVISLMPIIGWTAIFIITAPWKDGVSFTSTPAIERK
jgi:hypothetical protein